jgi:hypothetical protein
MRSLKTDQSVRVTIARHAVIESIRRGHYDLGVDESVTLRVMGAFDELFCESDQPGINRSRLPRFRQVQHRRA